jgi:hypothetical protein
MWNILQFLNKQNELSGKQIPVLRYLPGRPVSGVASGEKVLFRVKKPFFTAEWL